MACCTGSNSDRRKSLLTKLKDLVDQIDDKNGNKSSCCPPSCVPPGPVIEIYDPLPKPCLPVCSPCCGPPPGCPSPCPAPCPPPGCCPGTCPPPSTPVPCGCPPPAMCPVQLPPCMPICTPVNPPCVPLCNPCREEQPCVPCNPPQMMVCYRRTTNGNGNGNGNGLKKCKSREIRSSVLYVGCDCERRNGLQDDCQRTECKGSPECLTKPDPTCCPSQYAQGKHLGKKSGKNNGGGLEEYQCYPAYVKLPSCPPCGPGCSPCSPCPPPCGPCPPCGPSSCCPQPSVCCPPPLVPLIAAPPCPPTVCPGPPPMVPVGSVVPTIPCQPCCPPPCCPMPTSMCCPC